MSLFKQIKLDVKSILNVDLHKYEEFYFIVNEREYKTTRIISELLSPEICKIHQCDPTFDRYVIKTPHNGDFSHILNLVNFSEQQISESEYQFVKEVVAKLQNEYICIDSMYQEITEENVFDLLEKQVKYPITSSKSISNEIDFISSHFYEFVEKYEDRIKKFDIDIIDQIIDNKNFCIINEDQLLTFLNHLYQSDSKYWPLYEHVLFENAEKEAINEFLAIYNIDDITSHIWKSICYRLKQEFDDSVPIKKLKRYKEIFFIYVL